MKQEQLFRKYRKLLYTAINHNNTNEILKIYSNLAYEINELFISRKTYQRKDDKCNKLVAKNKELAKKLRSYQKSQEILKKAVDKNLKERAEKNVQKDN